jgi:hypothetical protein
MFAHKNCGGEVLMMMKVVETATIGGRHSNGELYCGVVTDTDVDEIWYVCDDCDKDVRPEDVVEVEDPTEDEFDLKDQYGHSMCYVDYPEMPDES